MFVVKKKAIISYDGYLKEFAAVALNNDKIIGTPDQPIKTKTIPKKLFLYLKNEKGVKSSYEAT
jgi:hypothetical protein